MLHFDRFHVLNLASAVLTSLAKKYTEYAEYAESTESNGDTSTVAADCRRLILEINEAADLEHFDRFHAAVTEAWGICSVY